MRLLFVGMMTVLALGFVSNAQAAETSEQPAGTPQEQCDAAADVVATADADLETVEKELEGVEKQIVQLRQQKKELTAKRDTIRKSRIDKRVAVKKAQRGQRHACKQVLRCKETHEKVLATKSVMEGLVKELSELKQQTGAHKQTTHELVGKFEALAKQEGELKCRQLRGKGGEPATVNSCHDTYESYGQLKKALTGKRKDLKTVDKRYKKIASKNKRKQSELKYLGSRVRQNCAADGPEIHEVEQLEALQEQFDEVANELTAINVDVQQCRKVKVKKPKTKRVEANVKVAVAGNVEAAGKIGKKKNEKKPSEKSKKSKKSKKKIKAKSSFEISGEASAKAKGQIQFKTK